MVGALFTRQNISSIRFYAGLHSRRRRILCAGLALLAGCAAHAACARNIHAECESRLAEGDVEVTPIAAAYVTNLSLGIAALTAKNPPAARGERTLGLTIAQQGSEIEYEQNGLQYPDTKEYCMRPRFHVTLSYNPIEVFVGREMQPGSCAYREVLLHEQRHVEAYRRQLAMAAANLTQAMRAYYGERIYYGDPARLKSELAEQISRHWLPLAQRELAGVDRIHRSIDTPQEYKRYQTVCNGEINRILSAIH